MMRKILMAHIHGTFTTWIDVTRYLSAETAPSSLFRTLHSDADFVACVCASSYSRHLVVGYLQGVPSSGVSMTALLSLVFKADEVVDAYPAFNYLSALEALTRVLDRHDEAVIIPSAEELRVLEMVVEDILCRLGVYTCSLPLQEYEGGRVLVSAWRLFLAIPCDALRGRHLTLTADAYCAGSREWRCIMRKVAGILSERQYCSETCLHRAWRHQWARLTQTECAFHSIAPTDLQRAHVEHFQACFVPWSRPWVRIMHRAAAIL
jgi:hypothetical protein